MKRLFDVIFSFSALAVFLPLLVFLFVCIKVWLGKPVIFCQVRPGLDGKEFVMYKFRTMNSKRDSQGNLLPDVYRLSRFGRFLRSLSLDEFPSLVNVLIGDMSIVGPRPLLLEYLPLYSDAQARRHEVKPGITGWAQVNGRNSINWDEKFELDVWYVENQSFLLDMKIILHTLVKVIKRENINSSANTTMPHFTGGKEGS